MPSIVAGLLIALLQVIVQLQGRRKIIDHCALTHARCDVHARYEGKAGRHVLRVEARPGVLVGEGRVATGTA